MSLYLQALAGGALIGGAAALLLVLNGRIAGISGITARMFQKDLPAALPNIAFVLGLLMGPVLYLAFSGTWPDVRVDSPLPLLVLAGLLVGVGSRMGSGCTSGHGVLGLARLSRRSIAATATFIAAGVVTVTLMRLGGL
jgi:uncharacterized membrane protein YedE/YeeE